MKVPSKYSFPTMIKFFLNKIWKNNRKLLIISIIQVPLLVLLPFIKLLMPKLIIDGVVNRNSLIKFILIVVIGYLVILAFSSLAEWLSGLSEWYNKVMVNTLLKSVDNKTIDTDYENVESPSGQQKRQKALNSVYTGGQNMITLLVSLCVNFFGLIFYGITVGTYHVALLLLVAATALLGYKITGIIRNYEQKQKDMTASVDRKLQYLETGTGSVQAGREIRLYRMADMLIGLHNKYLKQRVAISGKIAYKKLVMDGGISILSLVRNLVAYLYLVNLVFHNQIEVGDFVLMIGMISGLSAWMSGVMMDTSEIKRIFLYFTDFFEYLGMPEHFKKSHESKLDNNPPEIEFSQVCFRYEGAAKDTLQHINLKIKAGEKLAVVGANGSGKTTLIKILTGLYRPTAGKILMDGVDILEYDRDKYYRRISAVFQEIMFYQSVLRKMFLRG